MITENKLFKKIIFLAILFLTLSFNSALANLNDGLIGYWSFDQCSFIDNTAIQSNGIPYGSPTCVNGISGNAFKFGGVYDRDFAIIGNTNELTINDNFTFNMWFNIQGELSMDGRGNITTNGAQIILAKAGDRTGVNIGLGKGTDGKWYLSASNGRCCTSDNKGIGGKTGIGLNEWHMMSFSNGLGYTRIYLDGKLEAELPETEFMLNPNTANQNLQISIGEGASRYPFNGIVDELKIYNRVLDASDINNLYLNLTEPNSPTNLKQYVKSPELEEEEITIGTKIGKFQSGSGIILKADTDSNELSKLVVDIYKIGESSPARFTSDLSISQSKEIVIPYLGVGDYYWQAMIENKDGLISDAVDFGNNSSAETDFSLFEGFEPYPYGYKFYNRDTDYRILTGGVNYYVDSNFPYYHMDYIPGSKWNLFNKAFDTSPGSGFEPGSVKALLAFETMGLNNNNALQGGSCYGMSVSATMQYKHPDFISKYFPSFSDKLIGGNIRNKINSPSNIPTGNWDIYNDELDTILTLQLGQYSAYQRKLINNTIASPNEIINSLKSNPNNVYILLLEGVDSNGKKTGHAVIPYKIEGNKIYIWDNNISYPKINILNKDRFAYNQYMEINSDGTWKNSSYNRKKFTKLHLINIEDIYNYGKKSLPMGFNIYDLLFTMKGGSDIILSDSEGRISGFSGSEIYEQIPGVQIINPLNATLSGTIENTWKQIYLPQKIDGLTLKVGGKISENYDLMIAGGDYYTKLSGINTSSGQIDTYNISRENMKIDFDDNKIGTGTYDILVDDFQNNGTGTVYIPKIESQTGLQTLDINWTNVVNNSSNAVLYQADTNNDGIIDISKNTKAIENPQDTNTKKSGISGKINISEDYSITKKIDKLKYNDIILMLEREKDEHEEKEGKEKLKNKIKDIFTKRQIVKIQKDGTFDIDNLEAGKYKLEIVNDNLMNKVIKPETGHYELEIKKGFDYINKDFDVIKGYKLKEIKDKLDNLKHK